MLSKSRYSNELSDKLRELLPTACDRSFGSDHRQRRQRPAECDGTVQSRSTSCMLSSGQMTRVHPVPTWSPPRQQDQAVTASRLRAATLISFFNPFGDSVARDAEGTSQPTQAAAFLVGAQNPLTFFVRVGVAARIVAAATATISTQVALFAVGSVPEANNVLAMTMRAEEGDDNHCDLSLACHPELNHYQFF